MINVRSKTRNKLLQYFYLNEDKSIYINEAARFVQADPKNVYRILIQLEKEGILISEFRGKERYFGVNKSCSLYKEYKNLFLKTQGINILFGRHLRKLDGITGAYIFGSYAKGGFSPASDIDLLLVGRHNLLEAQKIAYNIQKETGREINLVQMRPEELEKRQKENDRFIKEIFSRKVIKLI